MRNLDLDQFWPMPPRRPAGATGAPPAGEIDLDVSPPPALHTLNEPPPLPQATAAELIAAAAAGWFAPYPGGSADLGPAGPEPDLEPSAPPSLSLAVAASKHEPDYTAKIAEALAAACETPPSTSGASETDEGPLASQIQTQKRRRNFTPLIWGGSGFIAGMLAWHVVGFWSFVSNVVLNANDPRAQPLENFLPHLAAQPPPPAQKYAAPVAAAGHISVKTGARRAAAAAHLGCVALAIDRAAASGTKIAGCKDSTSDLRDAGFNKRTDKLVLRPRLQDPIAWTGSTAVQVTESSGEKAAETATAPAGAQSAAPIETGTLRDSDIRLDLNPSEISKPQ